MRKIDLGMFIVATLGVAGLACGDDDDSGSRCGDGYCDTWTEACSSCPVDCGVCCGDGFCSWDETYATCPADCGCTDSSDCGPEEVCVAPTCTSVWGRTYRVTVVDGVFPERTPSGDVWDTGGSAADCYVIVNVDGVRRITTRYIDDTTRPAWNESFDATFFSTSTWQWWVYDDDWGTDDLVFYSGDSPETVSAQWLRDGTATFYNSARTYQLRFRFQSR